jgi:hypothetical protein
MTGALLDDPARAAVVDSLRRRILDWLVATSDVVPLERDPRMEPAIFEQLVGTAEP